MALKRIIPIIVGAILVLALAFVLLGVTGVISFSEEEEIVPYVPKVGRYYLELNDGLDKNEYIEIFDDGTIQVMLEHMKGIETLSSGKTFDERQKYTISQNPVTTDILINDYASGIDSCIGVVDENTLDQTMPGESREKGVIDHHKDIATGEYKYDEKYVVAHFVYSES